jgi:hypothetical protein
MGQLLSVAEYIDIEWPEGMLEVLSEMASSVAFLLGEVAASSSNLRARNEAKQRLQRLHEAAQVLTLSGEQAEWRKKQRPPTT